ncbi:MAG: polysaccharide deacetylase family protein [Gemmatimonadaceae bacterium]
MKLLVSIHDVTPAWAPSTLALWKLCQEFGVAPALFVVPNWHGAWPLSQYSAFCSWLRACASQGAEIFLHGERHDEVGLQRTAIDELRAFGRTAREGEFLTLNRASAAERITRGLSTLRGQGLSPIGFVPPAWLAREQTFSAVNDAGLTFSEDSRGVRIHARSQTLAAPAVRWSGRTTNRAYASAIVASVRWRTQRGRPLVRLALHPQDLEHPVSARSVYKEVRRWLSLGTAGRYGDL